NAYQPFFVVQLARLYRSRGVYVEAMEIEKKMAANRVSSPNDPSPVNLDNKVPVDPEFNWSDCRAAVSYELYIWKTREQTPASPRLSGLTESRARLPGRLDPDMIYIWQIRAIGRYGKESGPLWIFRTEKEVGE
ncbi:MAG: hypothetical protein U9R36_05890, partial [Elusimicrobiota bacterium]|nr:hypothetical protein [Elusimicrobiota bacterium]